MGSQAQRNDWYIEEALHAQWEAFLQVLKEMDDFVARPITDWDSYRELEIKRLCELNPTHSPEDIAADVNKQIKLVASHGFQFSGHFSTKFMTRYIGLVLLSQAATEAAINAVLAIGLTSARTPDLFGLLEDANLKDKWAIGPMSFCPPYELPRSGALYETLTHLVKERNALVHHRIEIKNDNGAQLKGQTIKRLPFEAQIDWAKRFFDLPYALVEHLCREMPSVELQIQFSNVLRGRGRFEQNQIHAKAMGCWRSGTPTVLYFGPSNSG
jgi:hypothetical protein